jgi:hypothetical protein
MLSRVNPAQVTLQNRPDFHFESPLPVVAKIGYELTLEVDGFDVFRQTVLYQERASGRGEAGQVTELA